LNFIAQELSRPGIRVTFADVDLDIVETLVTFDVDRVTSNVRKYVDDVRSTLMRAVIGGDKPNFTALRDTIGERMVSNLETEINTALMAFNRTVTTSKAQSLGFDLFIYLGPEDDITRPFCEDLLQEDPAIYTIEEIQDMDNGQGLPVLQYGGGYNCRHQWRPISTEQAAEQGYGD